MKNISKLTPLGSWCRIAHQINLFKESNQIPKTSYPLDWCITPGESLEIIFSDDFDINKVLSNSVISPITNSIQCKYTKIIFHHDLNKKHQRPQDIERAKQKFIHTYQHYKDLRTMDGIIFIRWIHAHKIGCHKGEKNQNADKLNISTDYNYKLTIDNLKNFLQHENFKIIEVYSQYFKGEKDRPNNQFELTNSPYYYKLNEKTSKDSQEWRGDTESWIQFLRHLTEQN